jgi:hypothetical protein
MIHNLFAQSKNPAGCPACDGNGGIFQFDWKLAKAEPLGEVGKYARSLLKKKQMRLGLVYGCPVCAQAWYLDSRTEKMSIVPGDKLSPLAKWGSMPQVLPPPLWEKAKAIGATPAHLLSTEKEFSEIPCRVMTQDGELIEKSVLSFHTAPPLEPYQEKIRFFTEIVDIEPSEFALSPAIRETCAKSIQGRGGKALTFVESSKGKMFALNWVVNFMDIKGVRGRDVRLSPPDPGRRLGRIPVVVEEPSKITFFIGDWEKRLA